MFRPTSSVNSVYPWYWDNYRFIIHEVFLYTIALLLKHERFNIALELISLGYYIGDAPPERPEPMQPFSIIYQRIESLNARNQRLQFNRLSLRASVLERRSHASGLPFASLMQADFVLFLHDSITSLRESRRQSWWPETLVYYRENAPPFEIFARAESLRYFQKIGPLIAVGSKAQLEEALKLFGVRNTPLRLPYWDMFHSVSMLGATNFERLATKP